MKKTDIKIGTQQHIRIKKLSTLTNLQELQNLRVGEDKSINSIINDALELALPCMLEQRRPAAFSDALEKHTQRIIMNQNRQTQKIQKGLQKLAIYLAINEEMNSSLLQEFEYFIKSNGCSIPQELIDEFKEKLPERFAEDKVYMIEKLLRADNDNE